MSRDATLEHLHRVVRDPIRSLLHALDRENLPFRLFEGFRSPQRQAQLYAKGRSTPGPKVTNAPPWGSYHQYGVAGDFVLYIDGRWSWDDRGDRAQWWTQLHELGRREGLKPLSWEKPHLQLADVTIDDLRAGRYPAGADDSWAENLEDTIASWTGLPPSPPLPDNLPQRPALAGGELPEEERPAIFNAHRPHRVSARSGLRLRAGNGTDFDVIQVLPLNTIVNVLSVQRDWCLVDVEGDGNADGFCFGSFLVPV